MKVILKTNLFIWYDFHIFKLNNFTKKKLNNLKVIHYLYF
jgi:hypothetical protein